METGSWWQPYNSCRDDFNLEVTQPIWVPFALPPELLQENDHT